MRHLLLALILSSPALAQSADLAVSLEVAPMPAVPLRPGDIVEWRAMVRNLGPDAATRVFFNSTLTFTQVCTEQVFATLAPGESRAVDCSAALPRETYAVISVSAGSDTVDPDFENNYTQVNFDLLTPPDLAVYTFPPQVVDAALPFDLRVIYTNASRTAATDVEVQLDIPGIGSVVSAPPGCTAAGFHITCDIGDVPAAPGEFGQLDFVLMAPDQSARSLPVAVAIYGAEDDLKPDSNFVERATTTFRTFFVTNTTDDGSGSLRQALHDANAACNDNSVPCKIAFRIANAAEKWLTIRPQSPLPAVNVSVAVDGAVQANYNSDSNPHGPEIEINGESVRAGNGIESARGCLIVRGLTINGFPGSGIHLGGGGCAERQIVEENYIGTDPTAMRAVPNQRGVVSTGPGGSDPSPIRRNVISGNTRSGIFVASGELRISENIIGLTRGATAPLGNGASGVYLGPGSFGTDVIDNYIGFNQHFGISLDRGARYSAFRGNSFQANWNLAIDFGLDGPTTDVPDESTLDRPVRRPIIGSAVYNAAADQTRIEGSTETHRDRHQVWVDVYANDEPDESGYGEGQYFLGTVMADFDGHFSLTIKGRPPGPWIAATSTRLNIIGFAKAPRPTAIHGSGLVSTTSEFSRTVRAIE